MTREQKLAELQPYVDAARRMRGWTFEHRPVPLGPPPPWDYVARAREHAAWAEALLDLGTGGGEVLADVLAGGGPGSFQAEAWATEEWAPNVPVAARRLAPLGVQVVHASAERLPFAARRFELVLCRHEALCPAEVARVLAPGGRVLTQQIHPGWHAELRAFFPRATIFPPHHVDYAAGFEAAGLRLVPPGVVEHARPQAYQHLGELVYGLLAAPWTIPDFDVAADLEALLALEAALRRPDGIVLTDRRYWLEAYLPD
jgi:SAM-dependent methyltransferase